MTLHSEDRTYARAEANTGPALGADQDADDLILICAFRYALGRRSYVVAIVADAVRRRAYRLQQRDRDLIVREIGDALREDRAGMDMDRREWISVHATLVGSRAPVEGPS